MDKPLPLAFTANGMCMLYGLADTPHAVEGHIELIRYLSRATEAVDSSEESKKNLVKLESKIVWSKEAQLIFGYLPYVSVGSNGSKPDSHGHHKNCPVAFCTMSFIS